MISHALLLFRSKKLHVFHDSAVVFFDCSMHPLEGNGSAIGHPALLFPTRVKISLATNKQQSVGVVGPLTFPEGDTAIVARIVVFQRVLPGRNVDEQCVAVHILFVTQVSVSGQVDTWSLRQDRCLLLSFTASLLRPRRHWFSARRHAGHSDSGGRVVSVVRLVEQPLCKLHV